MTNTMTVSTDHDPVLLWAMREGEPEATAARLLLLRERMTLTDLATACRADKSELRAFIQGRPPQPEIDRLNRLLSSIPRNRQAIAEAICALRNQGWSMAQIGAATGRSRQRISVLATGADPRAGAPRPHPRRKPKPPSRPAPHYRQARSLDSEQLAPLLTAHQHYLSSRRHRSPGHPERISAEHRLAQIATDLSQTSRVPLAALSAHLGMARATLPAICRRRSA